MHSIDERTIPGIQLISGTLNPLHECFHRSPLALEQAYMLTARTRLDVCFDLTERKAVKWHALVITLTMGEAAYCCCAVYRW